MTTDFREPATEAVTCPKCRRWYLPTAEPDPCLGLLPGVKGACCGHGDESKAYIVFEGSPVVIRPLTVERDNGIYRPERRPDDQG